MLPCNICYPYIVLLTIFEEMLIRRKVHLVLLLFVICTYHVIAIPNLEARATLEPISKIIGVKNDQYIDEFGRQRFFRGLNVVCKVPSPL